MKANFLITTIVKEIKDPVLNILQHYFEFASLETLSDRVGQRQILTDVIGKLHAIGKEEQVDVKGKPTKIRRMELILKDNIVLKVTLWRNLSSHYSVSTTSSTKIYINPETEEFAQLTYGTDQHEEVMEIPSQDNVNTNLQSRMIRNRITIQDLMAMQWKSDDQEKIFTILATINGIDDKFGWNYVECEKCHKKAYKKGDNYICGTCNQTPQYPTIRFRIQLKVSDQSATATFVLFDGEAKKLLGTTASNLITLQKSNDLETLPQLKNLCNLTLIFEVKLNEFNLKEGSQQYTVTKTFVPTKNTEQQHPLQQIKQELTSPTLISSDEDHIPIKRLRRKKRYKFKTHLRKKIIHAKREQTTQKKVHTTHQFIRNMPSQQPITERKKQQL
ncbi:hypothetical protein Ahy_B02g057383 [Arachis hypogaea]|uniref:Replication factor A C-terminal domain-containing protein n=1 Tax=Arachis hypogaea TaxID=3818 RepID=A0A445ABQ2_ARAHY|nr:hypothetical protein Ahy_B02g057383 [Arachis hypogaea]